MKEGNPLDIRGWADLERTGLVMVNRERGCDVRVLLDQKLRELGIRGALIRGYEREATSHLTCAGTVAKGGADVGIGCESGAEGVFGVEFLPLQLEWYDLVFRLADRNTPAVRVVFAYVISGDFKNDLFMLGGYDVSQTGILREF